MDYIIYYFVCCGCDSQSLPLFALMGGPNPHQSLWIGLMPNPFSHNARTRTLDLSLGRLESWRLNYSSRFIQMDSIILYYSISYQCCFLFGSARDSPTAPSERSTVRGSGFAKPSNRYIYIYIYIYTHTIKALSLPFKEINTCIYIYIYIYIYTHVQNSSKYNRDQDS